MSVVFDKVWSFNGMIFLVHIIPPTSKATHVIERPEDYLMNQLAQDYPRMHDAYVRWGVDDDYFTYRYHFYMYLNNEHMEEEADPTLCSQEDFAIVGRPLYGQESYFLQCHRIL